MTAQKHEKNKIVYQLIKMNRWEKIKMLARDNSSFSGGENVVKIHIRGKGKDYPEP